MRTNRWTAGLVAASVLALAGCGVSEDAYDRGVKPGVDSYHPVQQETSSKPAGIDAASSPEGGNSGSGPIGGHKYLAPGARSADPVRWQTETVPTLRESNPLKAAAPALPAIVVRKSAHGEQHSTHGEAHSGTHGEAHSGENSHATGAPQGTGAKQAEQAPHGSQSQPAGTKSGSHNPGDH